MTPVRSYRDHLDENGRLRPVPKRPDARKRDDGRPCWPLTNEDIPSLGDKAKGRAQ